jgi:hypothetical protein
MLWAGRPASDPRHESAFRGDVIRHNHLGRDPVRGRSGRVFLYLRSSQRVNLLCSAEVLVVSCLSSRADLPEARHRGDTSACYPAGQRQAEAGLKPGAVRHGSSGRTDDGDAFSEPGH